MVKRVEIWRNGETRRDKGEPGTTEENTNEEAEVLVGGVNLLTYKTGGKPRRSLCPRPTQALQDVKFCSHRDQAEGVA